MALYERAEKILAASCNYSIADIGSVNCIRWCKCNCPIYLYALLISEL